jgi:sulfonate transport system ATP-binding protein
MLSIQHLGRTFDNGLQALDDLSLHVHEGEILAILGGSGCGKSTLLRLIAGLDRPTEGRILLRGNPVVAPHPEIGIVFQEPRLLPWLRVSDNVGFGLTDFPRATRDRRVEAALERVGLSAHARDWPRELSGGMAQRAALARALVARPQILLLDEPFSALDSLIRASLQEHLLDLWSDERLTIVVVTHDIEEALLLGDRIAVLQPRPGRLLELHGIDLPRPRDRDSETFAHLKKTLRRALGRAGAQPERTDQGRVLAVASLESEVAAGQITQ